MRNLVPYLFAAVFCLAVGVAYGGGNAVGSDYEDTNLVDTIEIFYGEIIREDSYEDIHPIFLPDIDQEEALLLTELCPGEDWVSGPFWVNIVTLPYSYHPEGAVEAEVCRSNGLMRIPPELLGPILQAVQAEPTE
jgi:hypothetical protein